jgi:lactate permease
MSVAWTFDLLAAAGVQAPVIGPGHWLQEYDPTHHWWLSTLWATLPFVVLLTALTKLKIKAHLAALLALAVAWVVAISIFHMPVPLALLSSGYGAAYGLFPIFWIVFPVIFLYHLTVRAGRFGLLQECLVGVTGDSRLQLLLIAFIFGAFFEGASGFGTPVAVCSTILMGVGFPPLAAAGLALLANTAPVAFGAMGTPVIALHGVTGLDLFVLTRVIAAFLTPFCVLVPFWLIWAFAGFKRMVEVWPAILVAGLTFALSQFAVARFHGPWLVDISASIVSLSLFVLFLRVWQPKTTLNAQQKDVPKEECQNKRTAPGIVLRAAIPWTILTLFVILWGTPSFALWLYRVTTVRIHIAGLDNVIFRNVPVVAKPAAESAVFVFNWLSATGTGILIGAVIAGLIMGLRIRVIGKILIETVIAIRFTMATIATLMALAFIIRFCGLDATLGLACARTGVLYPVFGTMIGWLGTAFTGSDTSSNVLFGSLQKFSAHQLGISPEIMVAANSGGGVMGKMIAPQSVVIASAATGIYGAEGAILRFLLVPSIVLALLLGLMVLLIIHSPMLTRFIL